MGERDRFSTMLARVGVGLPRGVLGPDARMLARRIAEGDSGDLDAALVAVARTHWPTFRAAIGAALDRVDVADDDPALLDAQALVDDPDAGNPLSTALVEDAARSLAGVLVRTRERMEVLDRRLAEDEAGDALTRTVGDIVVDLLDLDPQEYEDEIADFLRAGDSEAARAQLARSTGDEEIRDWAREELGEAAQALDGQAASALGALAGAPAPEDPAEDPIWTAAILALVDVAVEIATVNQVIDQGDGSS